MGQLLFLATVCAISVAWWTAVYLAPWTLSLLMPRGNLVFGIGFAIFAFGIVTAAMAAYGLASPGAFVASLLTVFWGGWLMLAPSAAQRSSPQDADMMERLALMLVALMCVLVLAFYARGPEATAVLQLWLILVGAVIATKGVQRRQRR